MNYLAHAVSYLDSPLFMAGTSVPDMLSLIDRRVRIRSRSLVPLWEDPDPAVVEISRGIDRHLQDDRWFHSNESFQRLNLEFSRALRDIDPGDQSMRPWFLGHILIELLLDAQLTEQQPDLPEVYYRNLEQVDAELIQTVINRSASRPTSDFVRFLQAFCRERFLFDYTDDRRLAYRLNQVMKRVGLEPFDERVTALLPEFRRRVNRLQHELLTPDTIKPADDLMISEETRK